MSRIYVFDELMKLVICQLLVIAGMIQVATSSGSLVNDVLS